MKIIDQSFSWTAAINKGLFVTVLSAILLITPSCTSSEQTDSHLLSPKEVLDKKTNDPNVIVVDVRTPEEYAAGHIENARLINFYDTNWSEQMSQLDKNKPVIVYCAVGGRSGKAYAALQKLGFKTIYDMKGGFDAWKKNQLPIAH